MLGLVEDLGDVAVLDLGCVAQLLSLDPLRCQAKGTRYIATVATMWMSKWPGPMLVRYMLLDLFEPFTSPTSLVDHSHLIFTYHPAWKRRWQSRSQRSWTWHQQSFRHRQPCKVTRVSTQKQKIGTSICSFMTSPQAGAPTRPVPTLLDLGSILPTFLKRIWHNNMYFWSD